MDAKQIDALADQLAAGRKSRKPMDIAAATAGLCSAHRLPAQTTVKAATQSPICVRGTRPHDIQATSTHPAGVVASVRCRAVTHWTKPVCRATCAVSWAISVAKGVAKGVGTEAFAERMARRMARCREFRDPD